MKILLLQTSRSLATIALAASFLSLSVPSANAQDSTTKPDNSAQNKHEGMTADDQTNAKSDRMLTANVRKAIVADKGLSTNAHNVKILVSKGMVTLKGPVKSDEEKMRVKSDAESVVTHGKVIDQLTVKQ